MATDSTIALVTLADARSVIGKQAAETEDDALIEILIDGVSADFNSYLGRQLLEKTDTTLYLDGNGCEILQLPRWPVTSIGALTEDDEVLTEGDDYDYLLYADDGQIRRVDSVWYKGRKTLKLTTFKAGYPIASLPKDLKWAALVQVAYQYQLQRGKAWGETSRSMSDGSVSKRELNKFLPEVLAVLDRYRDYRL